MIRIGVVNIDVSHPLAFSEILLRGDRARYEAVYNDGFRGDDEVEAFIRKRGLSRRCATVEELADCTDIGFIQGVDWDRHLDFAEVFIKRGKPVFLDKPMVGNLADCLRLQAMVKEGAVVLGSSSLRYAKEIEDFLAVPVGERGELVNVFGTCGVDAFNYAIHIVESFAGLVNARPVSVKFCTQSGNISGNVARSYTVRYENGVTGTYHLMEGAWLPCRMLATTTRDVYHIDIDTNQVYASMLDRICTFMETGEPTLAPVDSLLDSVKVLLAAKRSEQNGGGEVALSELSTEDPGYDGAAFAQEYAAAARSKGPSGKIYLS